MFSKIKLYIYGVLAAIGLLVAGWVKHLNRKNKQLKQELQTERNNTIALNKQREQSREIEQYLADVRKEAEGVSNENTKKRITRTHPSGTFGDPRL